MKMKHRRILLIGAALLMALACRMAQAWNSIGHMSVAYAAYQKLSPAEKARVAVLLQLSPDYKEWFTYIPSGTSDADRDMYVFMMAATWPDEIKAMGSHYVGTDTPPRGEPASLNDGYTAIRHTNTGIFRICRWGATRPTLRPCLFPQ